MSGRPLAHADASDRPYSFFEELFLSNQSFHQILSVKVPGDEKSWGLFLGDAEGAADGRLLAEQNINRIVCCHPSLPLRYERQPLPNGDAVQYYRCKILDTPLFDLWDVYQGPIEFIKKAKEENQNVLVHCQKGISRSSALVIAYMMRHEPGFAGDFGKAFEYVEAKRPAAFPNIGFQEQLLMFFQDNGKNYRWKKIVDRDSSLNHYFRERDHARPRGGKESAAFRAEQDIAKKNSDENTRKAEIVGRVRNRIADKYRETDELVDEIVSNLGQSLSDKARWKRIGLFFENLHKYEFVDEFVGKLAEPAVVPGAKEEKKGFWGKHREDVGVGRRGGGNATGGAGPLALCDKKVDENFDVIAKGEAVVQKVSGLSNAFSPTLPGVQMAKGLAHELTLWLDMLKKEKDIRAKIAEKRKQAAEAEERRRAEKKSKKKAKKKKRKHSSSSDEGSSRSRGDKKVLAKKDEAPVDMALVDDELAKMKAQLAALKSEKAARKRDKKEEASRGVKRESSRGRETSKRDRSDSRKRRRRGRSEEKPRDDSRGRGRGR